MESREGQFRVLTFKGEDQGVGLFLANCEYIKTREQWREIFDRFCALEADDLERDREEFLRYANGVVEEWAGLPDYDPATGRTKTVKDRIEGAIFSLLVAIDGGAAIGPYRLQRCISDGDTGKILDYGPDLGGSLHELLGHYSKEQTDEDSGGDSVDVAPDTTSSGDNEGATI